VSSIAEHKLEVREDKDGDVFFPCTVCKQEFEFPEEAIAESCEPKPVAQA
jgi:hypothetical protein